MPYQQTTTCDVSLQFQTNIYDLIEQAAKTLGKTRADFIIEAAQRAAEETLLDQSIVSVDQKTYNHFLDVLDQPPGNEGFERLMAAKRPWNG